MRKNSFYLHRQAGIIHLLLIPVILLLIGGYLIFNKNKLADVVQVGSPVPSVIDTSTWSIYSNKDKGIEIKYPSSWGFKSTESDNDIVLDAVKNGYYLNILIGQFFEAGVCVYPPDKVTNSNETECSNTYVEFSGEGNTYRRQTAANQPEESQVVWEVYIKNSDTFISVPSVHYYTPKNFDENVLKEMDQILSTFKFTE